MLTSEQISALSRAVAAVAPIDGVADLTGTPPPYSASWHVVSRADGIVIRVDYQAAATPAQIAAGDNVVLTFDFTPRQRRLLFDIFTDLGNLTATQKANISGDLFTGAKPKFTQDRGENAPDLLGFWVLQQTGNLSTGDKALVKQAATAVYVFDNPNYLVHPAFDNTILVPGDEPVP